MDYNKTINLPKTDFPMRAGLPKREPEMLKRWQEQDVYHELLKKNEGKPLFNLHDGPPFSNGALHMGHALNKSIKDFITRSYAMRGYYTPYIPGWDNHGMPIESAIIKTNTGYTLKAYCQKVQMTEAARLLRTTELPVCQIAASMGYENRTQFYKVFRREYGLTPLEYRRHIAEE